MKYLLLILLLITSCKNQEIQTESTPPPVPVYTAKPRIEDVPEYVEAIGYLKPSSHVEVKSRLDGQLVSVHVKEGEWVEKGQKLFQIDSKAYKIRHEECTAELAKSLSLRKLAKNKHSRFQTLAEKKLISQNEWDQIVSEYHQAKADVLLAKARLKDAKLNLEYCIVRAHSAGRVGKVDVHAGQLLTGNTLVEIAAMHPLVVEFSLVERDFVALPDKLSDIQVGLLADPEATFDAKLFFSDNQFDSQTGQIILRAHIENPDFELRPGLSVKVQLPVGMHEGALLIPQKAVKYNDFGAYTFCVLADNTVAHRKLELGGEYGDLMVVTSGLTQDDVVITEGHQKVAPGSSVEIKL